MKGPLEHCSVIFAIGVLLVLTGTTAGGDEFNGAIECYFCRGVYQNSTCSAPSDKDFDVPYKSGINKGECKRGTCVKLIKRDPDTGIMMIERTCSHRIPNFHIIMAEVCRYESNGNGYLCMCGDDFCNHSNAMKSSLVAMVTMSVLARILMT